MAVKSWKASEPDWIGFFMNAPKRLRDLINNGPMPASEYGKMSTTDKCRGVVSVSSIGRCKFEESAHGRNVIYFDPDMAYNLNECPESVRELHSEEEIKKVFREMRR